MTIKRQTKKIDATDRPLGRLATEVAIILRGKHKSDFQPHVDSGDFVEVENCSKIKFSGKKINQKQYIWHSNYPGGLKTKSLKEVFEADPGEVLRRAVLGMLPKNKLRDGMIKRLKTTK